jgi:hypothetical protein
MKATARITIELEVSGTVMPIEPGSTYARVLADGIIRLGPYAGILSLSCCSPEIQEKAIVALEAEGRKLLRAQDAEPFPSKDATANRVLNGPEHYEAQ